ncbi:ArnT family glycosyltransferase [Thioalkalivibrio paradoxus]|uniref:Glycosyltransferase RgtA/B/C/D-like domain-containing protein n=1 Tax=Thioalkalivibrio paradoxus ARh 1 TaxID=713585 RepID=W0DNX5_9GAMM|nr:glycosyltransferase family 39 protein [Thioalkalivibrio paradoxus]AHF00295.1 hypothetical protein THITH_16100 [Thioalkalivibrio paradoxus ARh 1]
MSSSSSDRVALPVLLAFGVVLVLAVHYGSMLHVGTISHWDEYFTLERSHGFSLHSDWFTVYTNHRPSFVKPPLHYWLTAAALAQFDDLEFALRFWPFLLGLALLGATGLLAHALAPGHPYAIPAAILILAASSLLWRHSTSALLDTGAAFFLTLAIAAFILAMRQPRWWYVVALAAGLGALQKVPAAMVAVAVFLVLVPLSARFHDVSLRLIVRNVHFRISLLLGTAVFLWWPILQTVLHGPRFIRSAYGRELVGRFAPSGGLADVEMQWWQWILRDGAGLWIPAIAALFLLPFLVRRPEAFLLPLAAVGFALMLTLASGMTYERYMLLVLPILAASLGVAMARMIPWQGLVVPAALLLAFWAGAPLQSAESLRLTNDSQSQYRPLLEDFARALRDDETPVYCGWSRRLGVVPGAYSYHASNGRSFTRLGTPDDLVVRTRQRGAAGPLYRGLCDAAELDDLRPYLEELEVIAELNGLLHWRGRIVR